MRIYVGTYAKYNSGSIYGAWLDLDQYADHGEFLEACSRLHADEEDPEFMYQDWEGIPASMVGESWLSEAVWDIMGEPDLEAVRAYLSIFGAWDADDFQDRYRGHFQSWQDMAEELLEEAGELDQIPEHLRYYFDYAAYARDLRVGGDMAEESGYFFWNH